MPKKKKKKEKKPEEKHFVVPFSELFKAPKAKRARRAITLLKRFAFKHFRMGEENVLISQAVNEAIWKRGREKIPRKIEIKVVEEEGKVNIYLKDEKIAKPKKEEKTKEKKEETKEEKEAKEEIEKKKKEKKAKEKAAEASEIKRGKRKEK